MTDQPTTKKNWTLTYGEGELEKLRHELAFTQKHHDARVADINERIAQIEAEIAIEKAAATSALVINAVGFVVTKSDGTGDRWGFPADYSITINGGDAARITTIHFDRGIQAA